VGVEWRVSQDSTEWVVCVEQGCVLQEDVPQPLKEGKELCECNVLAYIILNIFVHSLFS
jgi:hypothetical protein